MTDYIASFWRFILIGGLLSLGLLFGEANKTLRVGVAVAGVGLAMAVRWRAAPLAPQKLRPRSIFPGGAVACACLLALGSGVGLLSLPAAQAANLTVTTTVDRIDAGDCAAIRADDLTKGDGKTSLREAICVANNTPGPDRITLRNTIYHLTKSDPTLNLDENANLTGDLDITDDLTLMGSGAKTTIIDAGGQNGLDNRVFHILNAAVNISGVTIQHGSARTDPEDITSPVKHGGGIYIEGNGTLALTNSAVISNTAHGFGGGIYNIGMIALKGVTIHDNLSKGGSGGGIRNDAVSSDQKGILTGINITISGNKTEGSSGSGGGLRNVLGTIALTNTTIAENAVLDSSVANKNAGAGIDSAGPANRVTLINTIIANNQVMTDDQTFKANCRGNFRNGGHNLEDSDSCGFDSAGSNVALELGPLTTANGGQTSTHALPAGSPAVDAANNAVCPPTDQRGRARVDQPGVGQDGSPPACDIGAFEFDKLVILNLDPTSKSLNEGDTGTSKAVFAVTLSTAINTEVTVEYATDDGSAMVADNDYVAASGVITFPPGSPAPQNIEVEINSDTHPEPDETFFVVLSNPRWAALGHDSGQVTIRNDDLFPEVSINNVTVTEGDTGTVEAVFTVTLSRPSSAPITVNYNTAKGTASADDEDYIAASDSLTFDPGVTEQTITVFVRGDTKVETDETFFVNLSDVTGARLVDSQGLGLILDNERVDILIGDALTEEKDEGQTSQAVFEVTLSRSKDVTITVNYQTSEITAGDSAHRATAEADYQHTKGRLTFPPGETIREIKVPVFGDDEDEDDEVFLMSLSKAVEAVIADSEGRGTIIDNDVSFVVYLPVLINQVSIKR